MAPFVEAARFVSVSMIGFGAGGTLELIGWGRCTDYYTISDFALDGLEPDCCDWDVKLLSALPPPWELASFY